MCRNANTLIHTKIHLQRVYTILTARKSQTAHTAGAYTHRISHSAEFLIASAQLYLHRAVCLPCAKGFPVGGLVNAQTDCARRKCTPPRARAGKEMTRPDLYIHGLSARGYKCVYYRLAACVGER